MLYFSSVLFFTLLMNLTNYFLYELTVPLIIMITKCCNLFMYYTPKCCKFDNKLIRRSMTVVKFILLLSVVIILNVV